MATTDKHQNWFSIDSAPKTGHSLVGKLEDGTILPIWYSTIENHWMTGNGFNNTMRRVTPIEWKYPYVDQKGVV